MTVRQLAGAYLRGRPTTLGGLGCVERTGDRILVWRDVEARPTFSRRDGHRSDAESIVDTVRKHGLRWSTRVHVHGQDEMTWLSRAGKDEQVREVQSRVAQRTMAREMIGHQTTSLLQRSLPSASPPPDQASPDKGSRPPNRACTLPRHARQTDAYEAQHRAHPHHACGQHDPTTRSTGAAP